MLRFKGGTRTIGGIGGVLQVVLPTPVLKNWGPQHANPPGSLENSGALSTHPSEKEAVEVAEPFYNFGRVK